MSNHKNHKRGEDARTEHGPTWEGPNPGKGCNSTHVAKSRAKWKKIKHRSFRRTGKVSPNFVYMKKGQPPRVSDDEGLLFQPEGMTEEEAQQLIDENGDVA